MRSDELPPLADPVGGMQGGATFQSKMMVQVEMRVSRCWSESVATEQYDALAEMPMDVANDVELAVADQGKPADLPEGLQGEDF